MDGGSLNSPLRVARPATSFAVFFMLRPIIPLTFSIAVPDEHTRLARL